MNRGVLGSFGQRLTNLLNGDLEDGIADERILPDRADQILFRHQLPGSRDEVLQDAERLGPELDEIRVFPQALVHEIERVGTEMNNQTLPKHYD
jgi:hypothetical protein